MDFVNKEIEQYCVDHSSKTSDICEALAEHTRQHVPMSVMLSGPLVASVLGTLIRAIGAKRVLEVGCFTGYSALAMAESLPVDGSLITLDRDPLALKVAQSFWDQSPHGKKIQAILGDAHESLLDVQAPLDLVFIDADKRGYPFYVEESLKRLSKNGVIVCDNALYSGEVLEANPEKAPQAIREMTKRAYSDPALYTSLLPVRDGLFMISKI